MIISQLRLENFQSHKDTTLNFHPNFNTLTGSGNSGKSSVARALSFILYGTWDTSWIRYGSETCRITLITSTGIEIIREKGTDSLNRYTVREPGKKEQVYDNFGIHIPTEVSSLLQIFKVQIDDNKFLNLNVASQMEPLFLLSETGSTKAKVIGKLSGAHFLDHALRELNKDKKNLNSEKNLKAVELLDFQKQLQEYEGLEAQKEKLQRIEEAIKQCATKENHLEQVRSLFSKVLNWKKVYNAAVDEELKYASFSDIQTEQLSEKVTKIKQLTNLLSKLQINHKSVGTLQQDLTLTEQKFLSIKEKYSSLFQDSKTCPTCFSDINELQIEKIKESL